MGRLAGEDLAVRAGSDPKDAADTWEATSVTGWGSAWIFGADADPSTHTADSDGLTDGQERGLATAGRDTDISVFKADLDPTTTTAPLSIDSDGDGLRAAERTQRAGGSPALAEALSAM